MRMQRNNPFKMQPDLMNYLARDLPAFSASRRIRTGKCSTFVLNASATFKNKVSLIQNKKGDRNTFHHLKINCHRGVLP